jgi:hypothetical protein
MSNKISLLHVVQLHERFNADSLFLHYEKIHYIHFMIKSSSFIDIVTGYNNKLITSTSNTKFHGIIIENSLSWKVHSSYRPTDSKFCTAFYLSNANKPFMSQDTLKLVYYFCIHSLMNYAIIFRVVFHKLFMSSDKKKYIYNYGQNLQTLAENCFKKIMILPFQSQYIFSLLLFLVNNKDSIS